MILEEGLRATGKSKLIAGEGLEYKKREMTERSRLTVRVFKLFDGTQVRGSNLWGWIRRWIIGVLKKRGVAEVNHLHERDGKKQGIHVVGECRLSRAEGRRRLLSLAKFRYFSTASAPFLPPQIPKRPEHEYYKRCDTSDRTLTNHHQPVNLGDGFWQRSSLPPTIAPVLLPLPEPLPLSGLPVPVPVVLGAASGYPSPRLN